MTGKTTWIIGNDPEGDIVVNRPSVSWRHCRLTRWADGSYTLEDLGSTNGTYINGRQLPIQSETPVRRHDTVTLGLSVALPWPAEPPSGAGRDDLGSLPGTLLLRVGRE